MWQDVIGSPPISGYRVENEIHVYKSFEPSKIIKRTGINNTVQKEVLGVLPSSITSEAAKILAAEINPIGLFALCEIQQIG